MAHKFKKYSTSKKVYLTALLVLLVAALMATLELTNTTHLFHKKPQPTIVTPTSNTQTNKQTQGSTQPSSNTNTSTNSNKVDTPTTTVLIAPFGNFVSSHHVTMGTPITSVCNTTSGATCVINFILNGVTKSLTTEMTDSTGAVYWNSWTPKSIGLSAGSWQIQATAILNNKTKTATDALNLEVSQ